ncbi:hypothetical protein AB0L56_27855 [Streptomyces sp. NPDC052079]
MTEKSHPRLSRWADSVRTGASRPGGLALGTLDDIDVTEPSAESRPTR